MSPGPGIDWAPETQQALEALAAALQRVDLDALLASEGRLSDIAAQLARTRRSQARLDPEARRQLETMRRTLARCRRLSASLSDVVRLALAAQGGRETLDAYGPQGAPRPAPSSAAFETQV